MTERLYYHDPYLTRFTARVASLADGNRKVYLDQTAFYPSSGGQPFDLGTLSGVPVIDVVDEDDRIAHILSAPLETEQVEGVVDWSRRYDHMQQHTGQHLLSAVFEELYSIPTLSFHLGTDSATIDIGADSLTKDQIVAVERGVNQYIAQALPVTVAFEDASEAKGLRKPSERPGMLRIVSIEGLDRSACGGTHVRSTAGIGLVSIRKLDKIRGTVRVEFLCGDRALNRARADFETLSEISRLLSAPAEETPQLVAALIARAGDAEKARRKLAIELAAHQGRQLHAAATPDDSGIRRVVQRFPNGGVDDELRALAQSFTNCEKAIFLAIFEQSFTVLLAASKDSGLHAGDTLKKLLQAQQGRGGGNAQLAQGSVTSQEAVDAIASTLSH